MNVFSPSKIYGIIGYPLAQTLSPLIHTTSFQDYAVSSVLVPWALEPSKIKMFMDSIRLLNISGCCVTIPHKTAVIPYLDKITDRAKRVGAVNLIYWENNQLLGDNTDVQGFISPLEDLNLKVESQNALILGAGGAARAIIVGLQDLGFKHIAITNRNLNSAQKLAEEFNLTCIDWEQRSSFDAQLIVNTTPLGMLGKHLDETPYLKEWFQGDGIAYDIVYTPEKTRFLLEAEASGWKTISGLAMFIEQANEQHKIWTGHALSDNAIHKVKQTLETKS